MSIDIRASARSTTMSDSLRPTPADWYVDPADPSLLRWWSGADWTEHTSPRPVSAESAPPDTTVSPAASPSTSGDTGAPLSRRELRARTLATASSGTTTSGSFAPQVGPEAAADRPPAHIASQASAERSRQRTASFALRDETGFVELATTRAAVSVFTPLWPTRVHTFALWLIAAMPLGWAIAEHASGLLLTDADLVTIRAGVTAAFFVITLLCAFRDSHLLRLGGHSDTAAPWWVLLTPFAYLIARTVRVRQETNVRAPAAVWVWLVATLPMIALLSGVRSIENLVPAF